MSSNIVSVSGSNFWPLSGDNISRVDFVSWNESSFHSLVNSFVQFGWSIDHPGLLMYELDKAGASLALKEKKAYRDALPESWETKILHGDAEKPKTVNVSNLELTSAFDDFYGKNPPKGPGKLMYGLGNVFGFTRSHAIVFANAIRVKIGLEPIKTVPCEIRKFETTLERYNACAMENLNKGAGVKALTKEDMLQTAYQLFSNQISQAEMRKLFGVGNAQNLSVICELNIEHPNMKIVEEMLKPNGKYKIPANSMSGELRKLRIKDRGDCPPDEEVESLLTSKAATPTKIASKTNIAKLLNSKCNLTRFFGAIIITDRVDLAKDLDKKADELNNLVQYRGNVKSVIEEAKAKIK